MTRPLHPVMLAGTGSDVGKSLIATGLCRIFKQDGYSPAPFKAQNMALNSYATPDGREIGRAQAVQAEACGLVCSTDMNPLLLKPCGESRSQVVLDGITRGHTDAYSYFRGEGRDELRRHVRAAFDRLARDYCPIVMEGAGSIAELNLRDTDLVNMPMARYAGADVILVADISRGGVFASVYGSIMLQRQTDRARIKGIIINKFRGDMRLFEQGCRMMEDLCGVRVLGVVPFMPDIHIDEEDSVALSDKPSTPVAGKVNMAVVKIEHISNYNDFAPAEHHPHVNLYYASSPEALTGADIIILPGTKSTIADLRALRRSGIARAVTEAYEAGTCIIGICGGYQMMGLSIADPDGVEGEPCRVDGLGILPCHTVMTPAKVTRPVTFSFAGDGSYQLSGYEIHMGATRLAREAEPVFRLGPDGRDEGCRGSDGKSFGTYIHGLLDNGAVLDHILSPFAPAEPAADYRRYKETQYDLLAARLRRYIDIEALYGIMTDRI